MRNVITVARQVANSASEIHDILEVHGPDSHSYKVVGYFVPKHVLDDLRTALSAFNAEIYNEHVDTVAQEALDVIKANIRDNKR